MIKQIYNAIKKGFKPVEPFDPHSRNDPLALIVDWHPMQLGGTNFKTRKYVQASSIKVQFKASTGAFIFSLFFLLIGVISTVVAINTSFLQKEPPFEPETYFILLAPSLFILVGTILLLVITRPITFDKQYNLFWKGRRRPMLAGGSGIQKKSITLDQIHAIQLIQEYVSGDKRGYHSYELNLIAKNGTRLNVIDHGNLKQIREDAQKLSEFLGVPVWDGITY